MKFRHFILLLVGVVLGVTLTAFAATYTQLTQVPTKPSPARLELSVGGDVKYYTVPTDQVIHVIADENGKGMMIQLIPDILPSKSESTPNGQQADSSVAGNVP